MTWKSKKKKKKIGKKLTYFSNIRLQLFFENYSVNYQLSRGTQSVHLVQTPHM
jgi:hypothetical protein